MEHLPNEVWAQILGVLSPYDVTRVALSSRSLYSVCQSQLYRHPHLNSYHALVLFVRTIKEIELGLAARAQWRWWKEDQPLSKEVVDLAITIDPIEAALRNRGTRPTAVMISSMIKMIARLLPLVKIKLVFVHAQCALSPIKDLGQELFPNVVELIMYLGNYTWEHGRRDSVPRAPPCSPTGTIWQTLLSGKTFPNCRKVEVHHLEQEPQLGNRSLMEAAYVTSDPKVEEKPNFDAVGSMRGPRKLESLYLEAMPELNAAMLIGFFIKQDTIGSRLTRLDIRWCTLNYFILAVLLKQAPGHLTHFTLMVSLHDRSAELVRGLLDKVSLFQETTSSSSGCPHLCPILREFGKNLVHFEFAAPYICRELFITPEEANQLRHVGIDTSMCKSNGNGDGSLDPPLQLDHQAISRTLNVFREKREIRRRQHRCETAVRTAMARSDAASVDASVVAMEAAQTYDAALEDRRRLIQRSAEINQPWTRRVIAWEFCCRDGDRWEELEIEADLEEDGIEWTLCNAYLQVASRHRRGTEKVVLDCQKEIGYPPRRAHPGISRPHV